MNQNPHEIQKFILKTLLGSQSVRFSDLLPENITSDHFNFHIKRLVLAGIVEKEESGNYVLTSEGKEYANRFDIDGSEVVYEKQAKIGVLVILSHEVDGETKYLIQKRLKQPFYGFHGVPGGKVKHGEMTIDAAKRELLEEAGLEADFKLICIEHRKDVNEDDVLLEDKYFYIFKAINPVGKLISEFDSGKNTWLTPDEIDLLEDCFAGLKGGIEMCKNFKEGNPTFIERLNKVNKY